MPCPFPGMDPYIERPAIWPDFHDRLITYLCAALKPLLRPRYAALTQDRLYVVESDRPIYPDVSVVKASGRKRLGSTAVMEPDAPAVFKLRREKIRQPLVHIIEPAAGNRLVTAIEVLSPDNKAAGEGRVNYFQKRDELRDTGANLVEIDLLREGEATVRVTPENLEGLRPWHYLVAVTRRKPLQNEVYPIHLNRRLPRVKIPLADDDPDVTLDLQAAFTRCWDEGAYPELLRYDGPPPGQLTAEEIAWCEQLVTAAGFRSQNQTS